MQERLDRTITAKRLSGCGALLAASALLALAGCAPAHVRTVEGYAGPTLPRPERVVVENFATSPDAVRLDQAPGQRIMRTANGEPLEAMEANIASTTDAALADALTRQLQSYGLPVEYSPFPGGRQTGAALIVRGQILSINEGNRARRVMIGLGAGKSSISAEAQVYYMSGAAQPVLVRSFTANSDSGRSPGLAEGMGVGSAAGHIARSAALGGAMHARSERRKTGDEEDAARLGDAVAKQIGQFAVAQSWIPPGAVR